MIEKAWTFDINFEFFKPAKTSRDTLLLKKSHFIFLEDEKGNLWIAKFPSCLNI